MTWEELRGWQKGMFVLSTLTSTMLCNGHVVQVRDNRVVLQRCGTTAGETEICTARSPYIASSCTGFVGREQILILVSDVVCPLAAAAVISDFIFQSCKLQSSPNTGLLHCWRCGLVTEHGG